jgi:hypothetical protein
LNLSPRIALLQRRIETLIQHNRATQAEAGRYQQYRENPVGYCNDILHVTLTEDQERVCNALVKYKWVLVPSANEVGKSFVQACLSSWHYDCFDPGLTIITAPSAEQIRDTVFAELRMLRPGDPAWMPAAMQLKSAPNHWVKGYTARHATSFHGRHIGGHVFVNFEEAEEIPQEFWVAADSMAHLFVAWYNPILTNSEAAIRERNSKYHVVRLSALDHPNVAAGLAGRLPPFPAAITLERVLDRLDKWATRLPDDAELTDGDISLAGRKYRPGPIAEARILGRRPSNAVGSVFSQELIDKLLSTVINMLPGWPIVVGLDVARDGDDYTVIHIRRGPCSIHHEKHNGWLAPQTVERIKYLLGSITGNDFNARLVPIHIDDVGYGGAATDFLLADGYNAIGVDSRSVCNPEFPNIRSQLWFDSADLVRAGLVDISRIDPQSQSDICQQLLAPKFEYRTYSRASRMVGDTDGRKFTGREVEPKKKTKSTCGHSPDDADAFNLCYHVPNLVTERAS